MPVKSDMGVKDEYADGMFDDRRYWRYFVLSSFVEIPLRLAALCSLEREREREKDLLRNKVCKSCEFTRTIFSAQRPIFAQQS